MERETIVTTFRELASEIAEKDFSGVGEGDAIAALGIDSLGLLELVGSIERELGAKIPDEALSGVETVGQLLDVVERHLPAEAKSTATAREA